MLSIRNVSRRYGDFIAVRELNLAVDEGTIFGFLGPNGAGKTTTMKMICGLIRPSEGAITVDGFDVVKSPIDVKKRIGYVPDRPHLYEKLTAQEYMYFIAGLYGIDSAHGKRKAKELIELFGLGHVSHKLVESFSHGMKQRLVMASVLLHEPRLMVVDEPMVGLDPKGARLLKDVLQTQAHENGMTVLLSTHTLDVADEVCDRVAVINHGQLVASGTTDELRHETGTQGQRLEEVFLQLTQESQAPG